MAAFCFLSVFFKPRRNLGKTDAGKVRNQNKLRKIKDFLRPYFRFSGFSPLALWAWAFLISFHLTQIFLFGILLSRVSRVRFPGGSPNSNNPNTIQIDGVFGFLFYLWLFYKTKQEQGKMLCSCFDEHNLNNISFHSSLTV